MAAVIVALGSNLGDKAGNLRRAVREISRFISICHRSRMHLTAPAHISQQPDFLNMAVLGETRLPPRALLKALKQVERRLGRKATVPFGPRAIDLDIIGYGNLVMRTPDLTIPHARMAERSFVLEPLAEIAPHWRHPVTRRTVTEMRDATNKNKNRNC
jgi:2-amino-4-hydroxy-6-hydroxymethyldihydropteridine diphosphokinase